MSTGTWLGHDTLSKNPRRPVTAPHPALSVDPDINVPLSVSEAQDASSCPPRSSKLFQLPLKPKRSFSSLKLGRSSQRRPSEPYTDLNSSSNISLASTSTLPVGDSRDSPLSSPRPPSLFRKMSLKNIRSSFSRSDDSEHHSLRPPTSPSRIAFLPTPRGRKVPPVPAIPSELDGHYIGMVLDTNIDDMGDIIDPVMLYSGGSNLSSPSSGMSSRQSHTLSSSSHGLGSPPKFHDPFASTGYLQPISPRTTSRDSHKRSALGMGPTDTRTEEWAAPAGWDVRRLDASADSGSEKSDTLGVKTRVWRLRIYWADNSDHVVRISAGDTVADITSQLDLKLPSGEKRETHQLYLKESGRERILAPAERPAHILRRRLEQAGYDENDRYDLLGGASSSGVPFILKFVYKSQFLGRVVEEDLDYNDFESIDLTGRSLRTIPVILYKNSTSIFSLRLSRNPMIDIPLDFIQSCTALHNLHLSHMAMKKVPYSIRHSLTLASLDLSCNRISTLEEAGLEYLHGLRTLYVQNNCLERLPRSFRQLKRLTTLNVSNNKFHIFPTAIAQLEDLQFLDISFNSISELPEGIGLLNNLEKLVIVGNHVSRLPPQLSDLFQLDLLDCRRNQISDLAVACLLPNLTILSAEHNAIHELTVDLGPRLTTLDVSHNPIIQLIDVGKGPFVLTSLDLSNAQISILADSTLVQLPLLQTLKLDNNSFRAIPESLGDLKWLRTLSCGNNSLAELPQSIGKLQKLESLDAHNNSLTELPISLWNCASLSRLNLTSNLLVHWHEPPPPSLLEETTSDAGLPDAFTGPSFPRRKPSTVVLCDVPPLALSLEMLHLGENQLTDEAIHPLIILKELRVLNLSFNDIQDLPLNFFKNLTLLEELFLSGNRLTNFPGEDLSRLTRLSTLFLNGNRLQTLPQELGKVKTLTALDVGSNSLKYNINNLDFDWNWNFNKNLKYLNFSGNKRLQIKSDVSDRGQRQSTSSIGDTSFAGFSRLTQLRVLGLMDVTITTTGTNMNVDIPDENDLRRIRTSSSVVNGMSYGIADTLGKNNHLNMLDLVHEFRGIKKDAIFALFGRAHPPNQSQTAITSNRLARYLKDNFIRVFIAQLSALDPQRPESVPDALRRSFLKLNQDLHRILFDPPRTTPAANLGNTPPIADPSIVHSGASGVVVYISDKKMYVANVGNALAVISRGGTAHSVSTKHEPYDRAETTRIRAAEGWITPTGLVNDELDISRSFGFFHLLPVVNARPDICIYDLTDQDEFVIIANRGLWDYVSYQAAVDIAQGTDPMTAAQKLRDFAISYGADGSTVIMVVSVSDLFKGPATSSQVDRRRRPRIGIIDRTLNRLREEVPPPTGHVAIVFTDIRGSTHLWGASYTGMITAMNLHNDLLRRNLRFCGGYEVRTEGDSFMCSFSTALAAVWWCMKIQVELLEVPWPSEILDCPDGKPVYDEHGRLIARGLSVRMGIHCGAPLCQTDPVTQRMDYFGLIVTRSSRIASRASGGHILCSSDVMNELAAKIFENTEYSDSQPQEAVDGIRRLEPVIIPVGEVRLKGLEVPEVLSLLFPATLIGRKSIEDSTATKSTSRFELNIAEVRDLAMLCHRLEITTSQRVFRPTPTAEASDSPVLLHGDPSVFLPPTADITEADLLMLLYSLTIRIENVGRIMQSSTMPNSPTLDGKNELVSALKALDERTLDEIWAIVRRDN